VTVVAVQGDVYYSLDNSTFPNATLPNVPISSPWYVCFDVTGTDGYQGDVQITWNLYNSTAVVHSVITTTFSLTGSTQTIYASDDGSQATNYNWGQNTTVADTYHIEVIVETTS
jgi:hypothetical protein